MLHMESTVLHVEHPLDLASVVLRRLDEAEISQREAAVRTGIPLTTLNRRLTGASPFLATELQSLASLLRTTVSRLAIEAENAGAA